MMSRCNQACIMSTGDLAKRLVAQTTCVRLHVARQIARPNILADIRQAKFLRERLDKRCVGLRGVTQMVLHVPDDQLQAPLATVGQHGQDTKQRD